MKKITNTLIPKILYSKIMGLMPICTTDVIFLNKERTKTLLFKRSNAPLKERYFSIGGRLLKGEKLLDGGVRQAFKEAGIRADKKKLIFGGVQEGLCKNSTFKNVSYHAIIIYYGYVIDEKCHIKLDSQHSDYKWFSVNDKKLHPLIKKRVAIFVKK